MVPAGWLLWSPRQRASWRARHPEVTEARARALRGPEVTAVDQAREMLAQGASRRVVAAETGLTRSMVTRMAARAGIVEPRPAPVVPSAECLLMAEQGHTPAEIARVLAARAGRPVKPSRVARAIREATAARDRRARQ